MLSRALALLDESSKTASIVLFLSIETERLMSGWPLGCFSKLFSVSVSIKIASAIVDFSLAYKSTLTVV